MESPTRRRSSSRSDPPLSRWECWDNELTDHYSLAWLDYRQKERGEPGAEVADGRLLESDPWHDRPSLYYTSAYAFPSNRDANWSQGGGPPWHTCEDVLEGC